MHLTAKVSEQVNWKCSLDFTAFSPYTNPILYIFIFYKLFISLFLVHVTIFFTLLWTWESIVIELIINVFYAVQSIGYLSNSWASCISMSRKLQW